MKCIANKIKIKSEVGGHLSETMVNHLELPINSVAQSKSFQTLSEVVNLLIPKKENKNENGKTAASLTLRAETISMFNDGEEFWLFNSHGGRESQPGRSLLIQFEDEKELLLYLKKKFPLYSYRTGPSTFDEQDPNVFYATIFCLK